eukprot:4525998-Pyramimonas_sp.AAC.1
MLGEVLEALPQCLNAQIDASDGVLHRGVDLLAVHLPIQLPHQRRDAIRVLRGGGVGGIKEGERGKI